MSKMFKDSDAGSASLLANTQGQHLLRTLAEFIQQVIQSNTNVTDKTDLNRQGDTDRTNLESQSEDLLQNLSLLGALENFIRATVEPEPSHLMSEVNKGESVPCLMSINTGNRHLSLRDRVPKEFRRIADSVTQSLQRHVFNNMPIRLLQFDSNGHGVRLIDRHQTLQYIMNITEEDLNNFISECKTASLRNNNLDSERWEFSEFYSPSHYFFSRARYAILSHTWIRDTPGDVVYRNWENRRLNPRGLEKITKFCQVASRNHGATLAWMDTICINKDSSSELDESIRLMYRWYRNAHICVAYLAESSYVNEMATDSWFTRGWTLQELLAPWAIKFYNRNWKPMTEIHSSDWIWKELPMLQMVTEDYIMQEVRNITSITADEFRLCRWGEAHRIPISRNMELASRRNVTRAEDAVYSLMGLLGVEISIAYGEGQQSALDRLVRKLLSTQRNVLDVFNCRPADRSLIPLDLSVYQSRTCVFDDPGNKPLNQWPPLEPIMVTHLGVRISLLLVPGHRRYDYGPATSPHGDYWGSVDWEDCWEFPNDGLSPLWLSTRCDLLCSRIYAEKGMTKDSQTEYDPVPTIITFGVVNFGFENDVILIPQNCLSVPLNCEELWPFGVKGPSGHISIHRLDRGPPVFQLRSTSQSTSYRIPKDDLARHGIHLVTLYL